MIERIAQKGGIMDNPSFVEICRVHRVSLSVVYPQTDALGIARGTITALCNGFPVSQDDATKVLDVLSQITKQTWDLSNTNIHIVNVGEHHV